MSSGLLDSSHICVKLTDSTVVGYGEPRTIEADHGRATDGYHQAVRVSVRVIHDLELCGDVENLSTNIKDPDCGIPALPAIRSNTIPAVASKILLSLCLLNFAIVHGLHTVKRKRRACVQEYTCSKNWED